MTDPATRAAILKAKRAQASLDKAEALASAASRQRDRAFLAAFDAGATYADLETATGLSNARVTQVLRRARETATTTTPTTTN